MKYHLIFHITTACNFDCSYCDVIKDKQYISSQVQEDLIHFIEKNTHSIETFKFFGWEPLLAFDNIKNIIDGASLQNKYCLVTNTSLLRNKHWSYFSDVFERLFFSIDSENHFDFDRVIRFIQEFSVEHKVYFNLIISPGQEVDAYKNFIRLYESGMRGFNILPVYFTQAWSKENLKNLSMVLKKICHLSQQDQTLRLYGFQENIWYETNLFNNVIFIDIDGSIYYSDIVSTFYGKSLKEDLYLGDIKNTTLKDLENIDFSQKREIINTKEQELYKKVAGQKELHKIMDYFSQYLNNGK